MPQFHDFQKFVLGKHAGTDDIDVTNARRLAFFDVDGDRNAVTRQILNIGFDGCPVTALRYVRPFEF